MQVMDDWMTLLVFFSIEPMVTWGTAILGNAQLSSRRGSGQGHPFEIVRRRRCGIAALGRPCTTADGRIFLCLVSVFPMLAGRCRISIFGGQPDKSGVWMTRSTSCGANWKPSKRTRRK